MEEMTEAEKRTLSELADRVWDVDATRTLKILDDDFVKWRAGTLSHDDLLDAIHQFQGDDAPQLEGRYQRNEPPWVVSIGLELGLIKLDEIPERLRPQFAHSDVMDEPEGSAT